MTADQLLHLDACPTHGALPPGLQTCDRCERSPEPAAWLGYKDGRAVLFIRAQEAPDA